MIHVKLFTPSASLPLVLTLHALLIIILTVNMVMTVPA